MWWRRRMLTCDETWELLHLSCSNHCQSSNVLPLKIAQFASRALKLKAICAIFEMFIILWHFSNCKSWLFLRWEELIIHQNTVNDSREPRNKFLFSFILILVRSRYLKRASGRRSNSINNRKFRASHRLNTAQRLEISRIEVERNKRTIKCMWIVNETAPRAMSSEIQKPKSRPRYGSLTSNLTTNFTFFSTNPVSCPNIGNHMLQLFYHGQYASIFLIAYRHTSPSGARRHCCN